jgi:hypothetical protein
MAGPRKAAVPPEPTHHDVRETTFRLGSQVGTNFIATSNDRGAPSVLLINTIRQTSRKRPSSVVRLGQSGITGLERMEAAGSQLDPSTSPGCRTRDKSPPLHTRCLVEHAPDPTDLQTTIVKQGLQWHNGTTASIAVARLAVLSSDAARHSEATCKQLSVRTQYAAPGPWTSIRTDSPMGRTSFGLIQWENSQ